ncbi:ANKRD50, partial [Symbiodinium microadriaticum]
MALCSWCKPFLNDQAEILDSFEFGLSIFRFIFFGTVAVVLISNPSVTVTFILAGWLAVVLTCVCVYLGLGFALALEQGKVQVLLLTTIRRKDVQLGGSRVMANKQGKSVILSDGAGRGHAKGLGADKAVPDDRDLESEGDMSGVEASSPKRVRDAESSRPGKKRAEGQHGSGSDETGFASLDVGMMERLLAQHSERIMRAQKDNLEGMMHLFEQKTNERISRVEDKATSVDNRVQAMEEKVSSIQDQLAQVLRGGRSGGSPNNDRRMTLLFGGWERDTRRSVILQQLDEALEQLGMKDSLDTVPFCTGPRRSTAMCVFKVRSGETEHCARKRMHSVIMAENRVPIPPAGRRMFATYSKSKSERAIAGHASWIKRTMARFGQGYVDQMDIEFNSGSVWIGHKVWVDVSAIAKESKLPYQEAGPSPTSQHLWDFDIRAWNIGGVDEMAVPQALRDAGLSETEDTLYLLQEMPRREAGWHSDEAGGWFVLGFRHEDVWRGTGLMFKSSRWKIVRRVATGRGTWFRIRHVVFGSEMWVGSAHFDPGDTQAKHRANVEEHLSKLKPTLLPIVLAADINSPIRWDQTEQGDSRPFGKDGKTVGFLEAVRKLRAQRNVGWDLHYAEHQAEGQAHQSIHDHLQGIYQTGNTLPELPPWQGEVRAFTQEELLSAVAAGKGGKAVGVDQTSNELLRGICDTPGGIGPSHLSEYKGRSSAVGRVVNAAISFSLNTDAVLQTDWGSTVIEMHDGIKQHIAFDGEKPRMHLRDCPGGDGALAVGSPANGGLQRLVKVDILRAPQGTFLLVSLAKFGAHATNTPPKFDSFHEGEPTAPPVATALPRRNDHRGQWRDGKLLGCSRVTSFMTNKHLHTETCSRHGADLHLLDYDKHTELLDHESGHHDDVGLDSTYLPVPVPYYLTQDSHEAGLLDEHGMECTRPKWQPVTNGRHGGHLHFQDYNTYTELPNYEGGHHDDGGQADLHDEHGVDCKWLKQQSEMSGRHGGHLPFQDYNKCTGPPNHEDGHHDDGGLDLTYLPVSAPHYWTQDSNEAALHDEDDVECTWLMQQQANSDSAWYSLLEAVRVKLEGLNKCDRVRGVRRLLRLLDWTIENKKDLAATDGENGAVDGPKNPTEKEVVQAAIGGSNTQQDPNTAVDGPKNPAEKEVVQAAIGGSNTQQDPNTAVDGPKNPAEKEVVQAAIGGSSTQQDPNTAVDGPKNPAEKEVDQAAKNPTEKGVDLAAIGGSSTQQDPVTAVDGPKNPAEIKVQAAIGGPGLQQDPVTAADQLDGIDDTELTSQLEGSRKAQGKLMGVEDHCIMLFPKEIPAELLTPGTTPRQRPELSPGQGEGKRRCLVVELSSGSGERPQRQVLRVPWDAERDRLRIDISVQDDHNVSEGSTVLAEPAEDAASTLPLPAPGPLGDAGISLTEYWRLLDKVNSGAISMDEVETTYGTRVMMHLQGLQAETTIAEGMLEETDGNHLRRQGVHLGEELNAAEIPPNTEEEQDDVTNLVTTTMTVITGGSLPWMASSMEEWSDPILSLAKEHLHRQRGEGTTAREQASTIYYMVQARQVPEYLDLLPDLLETLGLEVDIDMNCRVLPGPTPFIQWIEAELWEHFLDYYEAGIGAETTTLGSLRASPTMPQAERDEWRLGDTPQDPAQEGNLRIDVAAQEIDEMIGILTVPVLAPEGVGVKMRRAQLDEQQESEKGSREKLDSWCLQPAERKRIRRQEQGNRPRRVQLHDRGVREEEGESWTLSRQLESGSPYWVFEHLVTKQWSLRMQSPEKRKRELLKGLSDTDLGVMTRALLRLMGMLYIEAARLLTQVQDDRRRAEMVDVEVELDEEDDESLYVQTLLSVTAKETWEGLLQALVKKADTDFAATKGLLQGLRRRIGDSLYLHTSRGAQLQAALVAATYGGDHFTQETCATPDNDEELITAWWNKLKQHMELGREETGARGSEDEQPVPVLAALSSPDHPAGAVEAWEHERQLILAEETEQETQENRRAEEERVQEEDDARLFAEHEAAKYKDWENWLVLNTETVPKRRRLLIQAEEPGREGARRLGGAQLDLPRQLNRFRVTMEVVEQAELPDQGTNTATSWSAGHVHEGQGAQRARGSTQLDIDGDMYTRAYTAWRHGVIDDQAVTALFGADWLFLFQVNMHGVDGDTLPTDTTAGMHVIAQFLRNVSREIEEDEETNAQEVQFNERLNQRISSKSFNEKGVGKAAGQVRRTMVAVSQKAESCSDRVKQFMVRYMLPLFQETEEERYLLEWRLKAEAVELLSSQGRKRKSGKVSFWKRARARLLRFGGFFQRRIVRQ